MKTYDIAFSLGFGCGTSQAMRAAGMQFASYPLDWVGVPTVETGVDLVVSGFEHWMDADDMELQNVCHAVGFMTRLYMNRRTRLFYTHEFSDMKPFAETYPKVLATYERRIERFLHAMGAARRILAVWMEVPTHGCPDFSRFRAALTSLRARYPGAAVDLLVFAEEPGCAAPKTVLDEDGLTIVTADYRKMDGDRIAHFVEVSPLVRYLAANYRVPDGRTPEEKAEFANMDTKIRSLRWGPNRSRFRRWLNQRAYKLFRHIESLLQRKGLVHGDVSLWAWPEIRREAEGGAK